MKIQMLIVDDNAAIRRMIRRCVSNLALRLRLATEHAITRTFAVNLESATPLILRAFCEHLKADISCLWLSDKSNEALACTQYGAVAKTSNSVSEAFSSMNDWRPDVLLTDINMPVEDGYTLIGRLRASAPKDGANIPAIALTAIA